MNKTLSLLRIRSTKWLEQIGLLSPYHLSYLMYCLKFRKRPDMKNPKTINEKIMWLTFHTDTSKWTELADKYLVRNYLIQKGLQKLLVNLYGVYKNANEINFDKLPKSFVLKTNNGCGTVLLVKDKGKINQESIRAKFNAWLHIPFGIVSAEPHYENVEPRIIAEELLKNEQEDISSSIVDYKIWCFNGEPKYCFTASNRNISTHKVDFNLYELPSWKPLTDKISNSYKNNSVITKPSTLNRMIDVAHILSEDFPVVRVDLYEVEGKVYFGELTFTSNGCRMTYFTKDMLLRMGQQIDIAKYMQKK